MPHFGLIPETGLSEDQVLLLRAKLHIRSGLRRIREEKYSAGIATLYDALVCAMQWYILSHKLIMDPQQLTELMRNDIDLYNYLNNKHIITSSFNFEKFHSLMNTGLDISLKKTDIDISILDFLEDIFTQLSVKPFDYADLPPENPATF